MPLPRLHCCMISDSGSSSASRREVWEQAHEHVRVYDLDAFADMFAPDGVLELPFAPLFRQ